MKNWLRRIRGALGMGFAWGIALGLLAGAVRWALGIYTDAPIPLLAGMFGFVSGIIFSIVLTLVAGRRTFDQLSLPKFAGWGAAGGLAFAAVWSRVMGFGTADVLLIVPTFTAAVAACASGTLVLARRAERRELPSGE